MSGNRKHQAARIIIAALSALGISLGVVAAAAPPHLSGVTRVGAHSQSDQKYRNPIAARTTVKAGERNSLSPQPLPPGAR